MKLLLQRFSKDVWRYHATYDLVTGIWPLVHIPSFEAISGPKTDRWLVKMVAALVTVNGGVIASAGARDRLTPEVATLAIGSSVSLAAVDVYYVSRGRISPVYLLDALAEGLLIAGWLLRAKQTEEQLAERSTVISSRI